MKRSITLLALFIFLCSCTNHKIPLETNPAPSNQTNHPTSPEEKGMNDKEIFIGWSFVSDERYQLLPIDIDHSILISLPQSSDYAAALELLVDESAVPMTSEVIEAIKADPNASMVDNVLPDGRFLKDNWIELQNKIVEDSRTFRLLSGSNISAPINVFEATLETGHDDLIIDLYSFEVDGKTKNVPKKYGNYTFTPDGQKFFIYTEKGIWLINSVNQQLDQLSADSYNGKTYEALVEESFKLYKENAVHWNSSVTPSPDSTMLIYKSRKHNIENREEAFFKFDLGSGVETMFKQSGDIYYEMNGWLTSNSIVCTKFLENGTVPVLINLDGEEIELQLTGDSPFIYNMNDGLIAYVADQKSKGQFHIAKVDDTGAVNELTSTPIDGRIVMRGIDSFSPDLSYASFLYSPNDNPEARYIKVIDLSNNNVIDIDSLPDNKDSSAYILEYHWADNNTLLVTIKEYEEKTEKPSTWTYSLP